MAVSDNIGIDSRTVPCGTISVSTPSARSHLHSRPNIVSSISLTWAQWHPEVMPWNKPRAQMLIIESMSLWIRVHCSDTSDLIVHEDLGALLGLDKDQVPYFVGYFACLLHSEFGVECQQPFLQKPARVLEMRGRQLHWVFQTHTASFHRWGTALQGMNPAEPAHLSWHVRKGVWYLSSCEKSHGG